MQQVARHGVEGAERLVHQQDVGVLRERAGQGHPLAHAARQLVRPAVGELLESNRSQQASARSAPLRRLAARRAQPQRQLDVAARR